MCKSSSLITLFVGKNFVTFPRIRRGKNYVGENFSHRTKISSLFPDEFFLDKVCFKIKWAADNGVCTGNQIKENDRARYF